MHWNYLKNTPLDYERLQILHDKLLLFLSPDSLLSVNEPAKLKRRCVCDAVMHGHVTRNFRMTHCRRASIMQKRSLNSKYTIVLTNSSLIELLSLFGKGASSAKTTQFAMIVAKIKISNAVERVKELNANVKTTYICTYNQFHLLQSLETNKTYRMNR